MTDDGYRIMKALDANGKPVYRWMIEIKPQPFVKPLRCFFCTRPVVANPGSHRQPPYMRLKEGRRHDPDCELDPTRVIHAIARGSHRLASVQPDGTLRLVMPDETTVGRTADKETDDAKDSDGERAALDIHTRRPWLPPALNNAVKVARFLRQCDFDDQLARRFTLAYQGSTIRWARFCYGPDAGSYATLLDRVRKTGPLKHPVAVHGVVARRGVSSSGKPFVELESTGLDGTVKLRSDHDVLLRDLEPGMHVLAVGTNWGTWKSELRLWVEAHWNLAYWTWNAETEEAGTPSCPSALPPEKRRTAAARHPGKAPKKKASLARRTERRQPPLRRGAVPPRTAGRKPPARPKLPVTRDEPSPRPAETAHPGDLAREAWQAYAKPTQQVTPPEPKAAEARWPDLDADRRRSNPSEQEIHGTETGQKSAPNSHGREGEQLPTSPSLPRDGDNVAEVPTPPRPVPETGAPAVEDSEAVLPPGPVPPRPPYPPRSVPAPRGLKASRWQKVLRTFRSRHSD
ncbi:hypothetical protein [Streptomyces olivaceiscleroticus]|uniref:Uncharacterized protein n=1 Tax=Streptomyces olivaceiscleroticus TaxID=68245 RepID=A0ABN0ZP49_9ACTN